MKVLFIGGSGVISSGVSRLAVEKGVELWHVNRGKSSSIRQVPGVRALIADAHNESELASVVSEHHFDVVVDWLAFSPEDVQRDIRVFAGKCGQFILISSASVYQTPPRIWPVSEETPAENQFWEYSRNKIAAEQVLHQQAGGAFSWTIVRPSHTYDKTLSPLPGGYGTIKRLLDGRPLIVHGDGSSLWTLTHNLDFARGFLGILGQESALGETFHITGDEVLSWDEIVRLLAEAAGTEPEIVHIPSQVIARYNRDTGDSLLGDKMHSMIFDNSKIRRLVPGFKTEIPFREGARQIVKWYRENTLKMQTDPQWETLYESILSDWDSFTSGLQKKCE